MRHLERGKNVILHRSEKPNLTTFSTKAKASPVADMEKEQLIEVLSLLHGLLEEYAPSWYTQELHQKAEAALKAGKHS